MTLIWKEIVVSDDRQFSPEAGWGWDGMGKFSIQQELQFEIFCYFHIYR